MFSILNQEGEASSCWLKAKKYRATDFPRKRSFSRPSEGELYDKMKDYPLLSVTETQAPFYIQASERRESKENWGT